MRIIFLSPVSGHDVRKGAFLVSCLWSAMGFCSLYGVGTTANGAEPARAPNIVLIYADDLGYGDVSANGARTISTPHIDRIAREGLRMTDGHSSSATCTPSRYALMTGTYPWRKQGTGILRGNASLIIEPEQATLPALLQQAGYKTGAVGKWHLGLGRGDIDWNGRIAPGPLEVGFDSCFIIPATGDRTPCVFLEDHRIVGLDPADPIRVDYDNPVGTEPTGREHPELLTMHPSHGHDFTIVNGISRIGYMSGGKSARWIDTEIADRITSKAVEFIEKHHQELFFLYFASHDIHVPRVPHPRFAGKSGMGPRGDAILQLDWSTGQILETLDRLKLTGQTLIIFTSDNGPVLDDGYVDQAVELHGDHQPAGGWRGGKGSNFEAGTRVPFFVRWPGHITPGVSSALVCQIDFLRSLATLAGAPLATEAGPDSQNVLPALLGESQQGREELVEQGTSRSLRQGNWKFIRPGRGPAVTKFTNVELGNHPAPQLYDLSTDPGEQHNLAESHPAQLQTMQKRLRAIEQDHSP